MTSYSDDEKKREALKGAYPGPAWQEKVRNMTPDQVAAVYIRLRNQNKI